MVKDMNPVEFPEQTEVLAKFQPEYKPLPVYRCSDDPSGCIKFCWKMTWRQRLKILWSGLVWHQVLTFGEPLQPQLLTVEKPSMHTKPKGTHVNKLWHRHKWVEERRLGNSGRTLFFTRKCKCGIVEIQNSGPMGDGKWQNLHDHSFTHDFERKWFDESIPLKNEFLRRTWS